MSVTLKVLTFRLLILPHTCCRGDGGSGGEETTRLVGMSVTVAGECIDTFIQCIDIGVVHTPEDWCVQSMTECVKERRL